MFDIKIRSLLSVKLQNNMITADFIFKAISVTKRHLSP